MRSLHRAQGVFRGSPTADTIATPRSTVHERTDARGWPGAIDGQRSKRPRVDRRARDVCRGGVRPPAHEVNAFIDEHRARCGVEPICRALQVAPSAYRRHAARRRNPELLPERAQRDARLLPKVQRVYDQNLKVYGADKVWRQLRREGTAVARCTVERLMRLRARWPRWLRTPATA